MTQQVKTRSIARQVIVNFCLFAVLISAIFSFMSFMFLFTVEDEFLNRDLLAERDKVIAEHTATGSWSRSDLDHMIVYQGIDTLPEDMRDQLIEEPRRREFYGAEGRHYHLAHLADGVFLVAEVSGRLLIRPLRGVIVTTFSALTLMLTIVGCFIAYRLARRSTAPLTRLAEFVDNTDPEQLPVGFAENYPPNEVGTLADALEKSLGRIARFIKREQHFNRDVSHDLRTPIAVVSGAVEVLQKRHKLDSSVAELVNRVDVANRHMARTVEALLSLAREEDATRNRQPIKLLPVLEKTILQFSHFLDGKEVEVEIAVAPATTLQLQVGVLEILLSNLLGNAFEYTEQGTVLIKYEENTLVISDTGSGVEEAMRETMFEMGEKGQGSSGFGRGLSIVQRVCEHHGVSIHVDHKAVGTEVYLYFPA